MDNKFVINIGRQLGSGGRQIGERLASKLGIGFYDKELIMMASRESGLRKEFFERADERARFGLRAIFNGLFSSPLEENYLGQTALSSDSLFAIQSGVIQRLAEEQSCVFVGRCADYVLREHPRAVNIFICADQRDRIERITTQLGVSQRKAIEIMERADRHRASYYNFYSGKTWGEAASYHLCINSSALGVDQSVGFILSFARQKLGL